MNTEIINIIIYAEENGALLMLFTIYSILFYTKYREAQRDGLRRISASLTITAAWMLLLYGMDLLNYNTQVLAYYHAHRITHLCANLMIIPLCLISLTLLTKRRPFDHKWVIAHIAPFIAGLPLGFLTNSMTVYYSILGLSFVYGLWFLIVITRAAIRYTRAAVNEYSSLEGRSLRWLIILPILMGILLPAYAVYCYNRNIEWMLVYQMVSIALWWFYFTYSYRMITERNEVNINLDALDQEMLSDLDENDNANANGNEENSFAAQLKKVCEEEQLYLRDNLTREDLSRAMGTNHTYLTRKLQEEMGVNFYTYINTLRINYAKELMQTQPDWSMERIALESGYRSRVTFSSAFQRIEGCTPAEWKQG